MMNLLTCTLIFNIVCIFFAFVSGRELVLGNLIWRHGDRSPGFSYPGDPFKSFWKHGRYQLTEQGMAQEYDLGIFLRGKYGHLLSESYEKDEIFIKTTDMDRTKMSAQCVVAGLYSPKQFTRWNAKATPWIPFPLHTTEAPKDWLLQVQQNPEKGCPNLMNTLSKIQDSSKKMQNLTTAYSTFFKSVQHLTGEREPYDIRTILHVYDNFFCLRANGHELPSWVDDKMMRIFEYLAGVSIGVRFTDMEENYAKKLSKMRNGIILAKMIENMQSRIKGETKYAFIGYSAHDSTVTPLLVSMGAYNWILPPYASCVMIDLYKDARNRYSVEFWYRNDSTKDPVPLSFYECGKGCSFDKFLSVAKSVITDGETETLCGIVDQSLFLSNNFFSFLFCLLGIAVILICRNRHYRLMFR